MRLSGLQTDVLVLYRALLKSAVAKSAQKGSDKAVKGTQSDLYQFGKCFFTQKLLFVLIKMLSSLLMHLSSSGISREGNVNSEERL